MAANNNKKQFKLDFFQLIGSIDWENWLGEKQSVNYRSQFDSLV